MPSEIESKNSGEGSEEKEGNNKVWAMLAEVVDLGDSSSQMSIGGNSGYMKEIPIFDESELLALSNLSDVDNSPVKPDLKFEDAKSDLKSEDVKPDLKLESDVGVRPPLEIGVSCANNRDNTVPEQASPENIKKVKRNSSIGAAAELKPGDQVSSIQASGSNSDLCRDNNGPPKERKVLKEDTVCVTQRDLDILFRRTIQIRLTRCDDNPPIPSGRGRGQKRKRGRPRKSVKVKRTKRDIESRGKVVGASDDEDSIEAVDELVSQDLSTNNADAEHEVIKTEGNDSDHVELSTEGPTQTDLIDHVKEADVEVQANNLEGEEILIASTTDSEIININGAKIDKDNQEDKPTTATEELSTTCQNEEFIVHTSQSYQPPGLEDKEPEIIPKPSPEQSIQNYQSAELNSEGYLDLVEDKEPEITPEPVQDDYQLVTHTPPDLAKDREPEITSEPVPDDEHLVATQKPSDLARDQDPEVTSEPFPDDESLVTPKPPLIPKDQEPEITSEPVPDDEHLVATEKPSDLVKDQEPEVTSEPFPVDPLVTPKPPLSVKENVVETAHMSVQDSEQLVTFDPQHHPEPVKDEISKPTSKSDPNDDAESIGPKPVRRRERISEKRSGDLKLKKRGRSSRGEPSRSSKKLFEKRFDSPEKLIRRIGNGGFECAMCAKVFAVRDDLISHLRVHTREKPFKCLKCRGAFGKVSEIIKHAVEVHGKLDKKYLQFRPGRIERILDPPINQKRSCNTPATEKEVVMGIKKQILQDSVEEARVNRDGAEKNQLHVVCQYSLKNNPEIMLNSEEEAGNRLDVAGVDESSQTPSEKKTKVMETGATSCEFSLPKTDIDEINRLVRPKDEYVRLVPPDSRDIVEVDKDFLISILRHSLSILENAPTKEDSCITQSLPVLQTKLRKAWKVREGGDEEEEPTKDSEKQILNKNAASKIKSNSQAVNKRKRRESSNDRVRQSFLNVSTEVLQSMEASIPACKICGGRFPTWARLRSHLLVHLKPYHCKTCGMKCSTKYSLQYHEITHTDLKPHVCRLCSTAYRSPNGLKYHMQSKHSDGNRKVPKLPVSRLDLTGT